MCRRQARRVLFGCQQRQRAGGVTGGDDVDAGGDDGRLVDVGPLPAIWHGERAGLAALAARGEAGEHAVLFAGTDRNHPWRLRIRVVGVLAGTVVAGCEHADDAALVQLVGSDVDRVERLELARTAPGVAGHADRVAVAELVGRGVVEATDGVEDQQHRARAVADQVRTRGDAAVQAIGARAGAADGAGDVGAVAGTPVGVRHALDVGDRQHRIPRGEVGRALGVLHDVVAVLQVHVGGIDAGVVDDHAHASAAERDRAAVVIRIVDRTRGAGHFARFLVEIAQRRVEVDRGDIAALRQRADLGRGRQRAGDRQRAHGDALADAERLQRGDLAGGHRHGLSIADDDLQFVGGTCGSHPRQ